MDAQELKTLLTFYAVAMLLNTALSVLLWRSEKSRHFRDLAWIWAFGFVGFLIQGLPRERLYVVLSLVTAYPPFLMLGALIAKMAGFRMPWRWAAWLIPLSCAGTFAADAANLPFAFVAIPMALGTAFSLFYPTARILFFNTPKRPSFTLKTLAFICLLLGLHQLDFPFLRENALLAPYGFSFGLLLFFAASILAPVTALGEIKDRLLDREREALLATQKAVKTRDEFLTVASHELRTPLTPLKLQIQLLQRLLSSTQFAEQERVTRLLESSERSVTRLARLVNDLLEATSIAENKLALRNEEFDLVELAREIVGQLSEALRHAHCPVEIEAAGPLVGHGDRFRLEQVLVNLISNAMKYGANKPIRISITQKDGRALLKVSDQGIGISKTDQEQIFGRFERGSAPEQSSGLGLGLYISRAIVEQHRGKISVTSEPGAGSTFQVELPL